MKRSLKHHLNHLYRESLTKIDPFDPISRVRRYKNTEDREASGLIAAALAYGQIKQILTSVDHVLAVLSEHPASYLSRASLTRLETALAGFTHRFADHQTLALLLYAMGRTFRTGRRLGDIFILGHQEAGGDLRDALVSFVDHLRKHARDGLERQTRSGRGGVTPDRRARLMKGLSHLISSPEDGSACKRMNLFLRWMVRRDDGLDLGLWPEIDPSKLIMPLDTHTVRVSRRLGLLTRKTADWKAAVELTENLKRFDPKDPVKYDFALSHLGSEGPCRKNPNEEDCKRCTLLGFCTSGKGGL
ncbi:TIGR02757 family protein [Acidobacteriota bacterium]